MATSGRTSFSLTTLLTHAMRRAKVPGQGITSEHMQIAKECLTLALSAMHNEKMPLWCQESIVLPIYENEEQVTLPEGSIEVMKAFYRNVPRLGDAFLSSDGGTVDNVHDGNLTTACTQAAINGNIRAQFFSTYAVSMVGFMPNGDQFYSLAFDASNDGIVWTTIQVVAPPDGEVATKYLDKTWYWYEILKPATSLFFRIRETSGGILNLREFVMSAAPTDTLMYRMNRDQYLLQPNKRASGRPLQYWIKRVQDQPVMYLWPVPRSEDSFNAIYLWRHRYIADIGDFNVPLELPLRWYDGVCWRLASYCAAEIQEAQGDPVALKQMSDQSISGMQSEERDRSPVIIRPNLRRYMR